MPVDMRQHVVLFLLRKLSDLFIVCLIYDVCVMLLSLSSAGHRLWCA